MWPNPQFPADLVVFAEEILNGKLHFLGSGHWLSWFIFIMSNNKLGDASVTFMIWSLFLTEKRFHISKCNIKKQQVYWSLSVLLDHLTRFIYCPHKHRYISSVTNLLVKVTVWVCTDRNCYQSCHVLPKRTGLSPRSSEIQSTLQLICLTGR